MSISEGFRGASTAWLFVRELTYLPSCYNVSILLTTRVFHVSILFLIFSPFFTLHTIISKCRIISANVLNGKSRMSGYTAASYPGDSEYK